jgi:hypothetical protein
MLFMNQDTNQFSLSELKMRLESKENFQPLLDYFIQKSIKDKKDQEINKDNPYSYSNFYELFIKNYSQINADYIFEFCQSPIERIFISSLLLLFIKNDDLGLNITPALPDIELGIANYRHNHRNILKFVESYKNKTDDHDLENFESSFEEKISSGKYTKDDYYEIFNHYYIVKNFTYNRYHLTVQPGFPHYKIDGKSIRPDILIWCPGNEKIKLIIECDGYEFHSSKYSFENDRKRDRLLKLNGYQVIRFSGSEINKDPVAVSKDLYDFIEKTYENEISIKQ